MIIHHVYKKNGDWVVAYEVRGEWKPKNDLLINLVGRCYES